MSLLFGVVFGGTAAWAAVKLPDKPIIVLCECVININ